MVAAAFESALGRLEEVAPVIESGALESERLGRLSPMVIDALRDADLFRFFTPVEFGGYGLTLSEGTRLTEGLAELDASTAWTVATLASGQLLIRFLPEDVFAGLSSDPTALIAATLNAATGRAEEVDGGFIFSGAATYLSGSAHSRWVWASAIVTRNGRPVVGDAGYEVRCGVFPLDQAHCLDNWNSTGMRATGSNDYTYDQVHVDESWTHALLHPRPRTGDDVFNALPLASQLGGGITASVVGTARNMIDRFIEVAGVKVPVGGNLARLAERAPAQIALGEAHGLHQAAHAVMMQTVDEVWARGAARQTFDSQALARQRLGFVTAVRLAARAVDLLHEAAGMSAAASESVLERCWRDVHTMTQHVLLSPARFEITGRVLFGLDPGVPFI